MNDELITIYEPIQWDTKEDVYRFIAESVFPGENERALSIEKALHERERTGNIQIDERVVLPHVEDDSVPYSKVMILRPEQVIAPWSESVSEVDLIIVVLLAPDASTETKQTIAALMRRLAQEDFLETLRTTKKQTI